MTTHTRLIGWGLAATLTTSTGAAVAGPVIVSVPPGVQATQDAKLVNLTPAASLFKDGEDIVLFALRNKAGKCDRLSVEIDGVSESRQEVSFPLSLVIAKGTKLYPKEGKHNVVLRGQSANCSGEVHAVFTTAETKPTQGQGHVTGMRINDYPANGIGRLVVQGTGTCRIRVMLQPSPWNLGLKPEPPPLYKFDFGEPVQLPLVASILKPLPEGEYTAWIIALDSNDKGEPDPEIAKQYPKYKGCVLQDNRHPRPYTVRGMTLTFRTGVGTLYAINPADAYSPANEGPKASASSGGSSSSGANASSGGTPPGGGGGNGTPTLPANGKLVSLQVPGGSFAEDETQKLQASGQGGCGFDLVISNKSYGGSTEQNQPVLPLKLDGGAILYNGTHFGTLAEGSWKATATGKNGCTGSATIDFKVTPKTSTRKVLGKPVVGFDQQPKSGGVFSASKDGNIWLKVTVPQTIKDEPYATCCDVEFDYLNPYGGWEPLPNSPFSDSSYALALKQAAGVVPKSVSYFSNGTQWRVKVRASKFKTEFEWSDWASFKVDQH